MANMIKRIDDLINFDSPAKSLEPVVNLPLIPCPLVKVIAGDVEESNPFDAVAHSVETYTENDPFEIVFNNTVKPLNNFKCESKSNNDNACLSSLSNYSKCAVSYTSPNSRKRTSLKPNSLLNEFENIDDTIKNTSLYNHFPGEFEDKILNRSISFLTKTENHLNRNLNSSIKSLSVNDLHNITVAEFPAIPFEEIKMEALKLTELLAYQFPVEEENISDVKAPWLNSSISSEDEAGLPNLKHNSSKNFDLPSNEELAVYKRRIRASLSKIEVNDSLLQNENEKPYEVKQVTDSTVITNENLPTRVTDKPNGEEVFNQSIKTKGIKISNDSKKGPLKALVPLQKMSRAIISKLGSPKVSNDATYHNESKIDNSMSISMIHPVAASTPESKKDKHYLENTSTPINKLRGRQVGKLIVTKRSNSLCSKFTQKPPETYNNSISSKSNAPIKQTLTRPKSATTNRVSCRDALTALVSRPQPKAKLLRKISSEPKLKKVPNGESLKDKENLFVKR